MATFYEQSPPLLGIGDDVRYFDDGKDGHPQKWVNGKVTAIAEDSFEVQWEDLPDATEYEWSKVSIIGNRVYEPKLLLSMEQFIKDGI
jgi:hypothetical protein